MRGLRAGILGLVVAAALAVAGQATAGNPGDFTIQSVHHGSSHGLSYTSATNPNATSGNNYYVAAVCPPAKVLTGGGSEVGGTDNGAWLMSSSPDWWDPIYVPATQRRAFTTGVHNESGASTSVSSWAICAARQGLRMRAKTRGTTITGETFGARAKCKHGASVTGGGFYAEGNQDEVLASAPFDGADADKIPDDGWRAKIIASQDLRHIFVYANCTKRMDLLYKQKSAALNLGDALNVNCPSTRAVSGGGAEITNGTNGRLRRLVPADDGDPGSVPDDRWSAAASGGVLLSSDWTVYAICKA